MQDCSTKARGQDVHSWDKELIQSLNSDELRSSDLQRSSRILQPHEVVENLLFGNHTKRARIGGFSTCLFEKKSCAQKLEGLLSDPSWQFLKRNKLGPDNNPYLDQIITPQNSFSLFCFFCCLKLFTVFLNINKSWQIKMARKNYNFSHFAKHRL